MKFNTLYPAFLILTTATYCFAQSDDILANSGTFKPTITISDTYAEAIRAEVDEGVTSRSVEAKPQRIALTVKANIADGVAGVIDEDTSVSIKAGNFSHNAMLGEAEDYKETGKQVTFPLVKEVEQANGDLREVRVGTIKYAWTTKLLTVTVTCTDIEAAGVSDIAASEYLGLAEVGVPVKITDDPLEVAVSFGEAAGARRVFLRGTAKTVLKTFGSEAADNYEEFELQDVTLQGVADVTAPVLKSTFPTKPNTLAQVNIVGTATDVTAVTLASVTLNGLPATAANVAISDDDANGTWSWSVTGLALKKGRNEVVITFSDEEGNTSKAVKTYTLK